LTRLTTCVDAEAVATRAVAEIVRHLRVASRDRGVAHLALSGGRSPSRTYELLACQPLDWPAIEAWFADERCVAPDDEQSNYRLAFETLLGPAGLPPARVHRMQGELGPEDGASRYAQELRAHVELLEDGLPVLDLIVLGIGPDGHVASLFPDAPTLDPPTLDGDEQALCVGVADSPKPPPHRITLSLAVLRAARRCLLLATGASKADAVNAMLAQPSRHVPASLLRRERLTVIVDDAASPPAGSEAPGLLQ
jgi:6-phosphogluconolactonase